MQKKLISAASGCILLCFGISAGASERLEDGKRAYDKICSACHETGIEGAPVVGNAEDWSPRSDLWEAVLVEHAQQGFIKMPAKGNAEHATDYDVGAAAEYMLTLTHPEMKSD